MSKIFKKDIIHKCSYCKYAAFNIDNMNVMCRKKGIMEKSDCCRSYKYDPLKRTPEKKKTLGEYKSTDFIF